MKALHKCSSTSCYCVCSKFHTYQLQSHKHTTDQIEIVCTSTSLISVWNETYFFLSICVDGWSTLSHISSKTSPVEYVVHIWAFSPTHCQLCCCVFSYWSNSCNIKETWLHILPITISKLSLLYFRPHWYISLSHCFITWLNFFAGKLDRPYETFPFVHMKQPKERVCKMA